MKYIVQHEQAILSIENMDLTDDDIYMALIVKMVKDIKPEDLKKLFKCEKIDPRDFSPSEIAASEELHLLKRKYVVKYSTTVNIKED